MIPSVHRIIGLGILLLLLLRPRFLTSGLFCGGDDRDHDHDLPFRPVLLGGDRDRLRLRLLLGDLRPRFLLDWGRRLSLLRLPLLLLSDAPEDIDRLEELLRYLFLFRERIKPSFLRLLLLQDGDRLRLLELLLFPRLLLGGDLLRLRDDDLLLALRSPPFSLGESFFEEIILGGDWLRLRLPLLLLFARLPSFPLPLGGDLLEERPRDLLGERLLFLSFPLGGDFLEPLLGGDLLKERERDLLRDRFAFLSLPLGGDLLLEDRRGDLLDERLLCLLLPLGDLLVDLRWSGSCFEEMIFGGDLDRSRLVRFLPSFLRLLDNDDDGDLDLLADLLRSSRLFPFVITLGGDRDRPLFLPPRRFPFLALLLDLESSLDRDETDESLLCPLLLLLLLPRLLRFRPDERPLRPPLE